MNEKNLNEHLREYLVGATDYRAYRLVACHFVDGPEAKLWERQESDCSAFDNGYIGSEVALKRELLGTLIAYYQRPLLMTSFTSNISNLATLVQ